CGVADDASGLFSKLIYSHNVTKNKRDYQLLLPFSYPELTLYINIYIHTYIYHHANCMVFFLTNRTVHPPKPLGGGVCIHFPLVQAEGNACTSEG
ncbi:hypothetical protein, partial [Bacteroides heparinolyticus]|uniref:hypothetical protein n=1 Tax=Prevotella heparinolytica TaxID=28113 RepID=UPI00359FCB99